MAIEERRQKGVWVGDLMACVDADEGGGEEGRVCGALREIERFSTPLVHVIFVFIS